METDAQFQFDVFLCHNSEDKDAVIKIAEQLKDEYEIEPWLDDWELRPGLPWQPELEKQIAHIKSAAVFVGKSGIGPWQEDEINAFLRQFKQRQCPVIPVLLPDAPQKPNLPLFLQGITWVDFREQTRVYFSPMGKLIWGITGKKPQTIVKVFIDGKKRLPQWFLFSGFACGRYFLQNPRYLAAHSSKFLPNCKNAGCHRVIPSSLHGHGCHSC